MLYQLKTRKSINNLYPFKYVFHGYDSNHEYVLQLMQQVSTYSPYHYLREFELHESRVTRGPLI